MHRLSYKLMLLFTILATLGGVLTLIPASGASYPNILGYSSLCTFAPAASFFCFLIAGITCFIRSAFIKDQSGTAKERLNKHSPAFIPLTLVLILALGSTLWFNNVKSKYVDAQTAATAAEEEK